MYAAKTAENSNESLCTIFLGATCLLTCRYGIASLTYHVTGPFATSGIMTWCSAQIVGNNMNNMGIPMKHIKCKTAIRNAPHRKKTSERKGRACDVLYVIWALGLNMGRKQGRMSRSHCLDQSLLQERGCLLAPFSRHFICCYLLYYSACLRNSYFKTLTWNALQLPVYQTFFFDRTCWGIVKVLSCERATTYLQIPDCVPIWLQGI